MAAMTESPDRPANAPAPARRVDWRLLRAQVRAVARLELRSILSLRSGFFLSFLAGMPVVLMALHALFTHRGCRLDEDSRVLAGLVQVYYLRLAIFFGCLGVFGRLFRGEVVARTLHHFFLAPMRREVLVAGKYLGAAVGTSLVFVLGLTATFALTFGHLGAAGWDFVWRGPGLGHLGAYLLVATLACFGYGAIFLVLGVFLRNPGVPSLLLLGWETFSGVLPAWLQRLSVTYYLKPLLPIGLPDEGPGALFSVVVEPVAAWVAVTGLMVFALAVVALACWRVRHLEINYSTD
jgi:ABC-type transport system involved in multi-copper enzyme maturation permease subunit